MEDFNLNKAKKGPRWQRISMKEKAKNDRRRLHARTCTKQRKDLSLILRGESFIRLRLGRQLFNLSRLVERTDNAL